MAAGRRARKAGRGPGGAPVVPASCRRRRPARRPQDRQPVHPPVSSRRRPPPVACGSTISPSGPWPGARPPGAPPAAPRPAGRMEHGGRDRLHRRRPSRTAPPARDRAAPTSRRTGRPSRVEACCWPRSGPGIPSRARPPGSGSPTAWTATWPSPCAPPWPPTSACRLRPTRSCGGLTRGWRPAASPPGCATWPHRPSGGRGKSPSLPGPGRSPPPAALRST